MTVRLVTPTPKGMIHIAQNMRAPDREEIFATRWDDDPVSLALDSCAITEMSWMALLDDEPVAAIGATPLWPRCWSVWAFGTDKWDNVVLTLTKHVSRFMFPAITAIGLRAQCFTLSTHTQAHRWLEFCGMDREATLPNFGKNGETFYLYAWRRDTGRTPGRRKGST